MTGSHPQRDVRHRPPAVPCPRLPIGDWVGLPTVDPSGHGVEQHCWPPAPAPPPSTGRPSGIESAGSTGTQAGPPGSQASAVRRVSSQPTALAQLLNDEGERSSGTCCALGPRQRRHVTALLREGVVADELWLHPADAVQLAFRGDIDLAAAGARLLDADPETVTLIVHRRVLAVTWGDLDHGQAMVSGLIDLRPDEGQRRPTPP